MNGSSSGAKTIEVLGLHQDDHRADHVKHRVEPEIEALREQMNRGDATAVKVTWHRTMRKLFAPMQPFHAVTWDVLDAAFPVDERQRRELELPSLGAVPDDHPTSALFVDSPERALMLTALPEELALRVRALGDRARQDEMLPLIAELEAIRGWTDEELAALLGRQLSTIRQIRRGLKAATAADAAVGQQPPDSDS